jgi:acetylglutamate kinase
MTQTRILLKIGGRAFEGAQGFQELAMSIKSLPQLELIIVHGGGAEISQALKEAKRETRFIDGIRVTQAEDVRIVEAVLSGTINQRIADWLSAEGIACRRMSGKTDHLLQVEPMTRGGLNWGYVGEIKQVDPAAVLQALKEGRVPIVSPISADAAGSSYNVNADSAAAALASAAGCTDLIFVTDVAGVLVNQEVQPVLSLQQAQSLIADGAIQGGMVAKLESAFKALAQAVPRVHITRWQGPQTLIRVVDRKPMTGTVIQ